MTQVDLKRKTINGFFWSLIESILSQGLTIVFGIFLVRILPIKEFGLLGEIAIFIAVAQVFIDSGLSQALIRKQNCTPTDYSTVFWANISIGICAFILLWVFAPMISVYFKEPQVISLIRVASLALLIGSLTVIQQTILIKEIDFRTNTKISTISTVVSGIVAIGMALSGFGVWSLVWRSIINQGVRSVLLWRHNRWIPHWEYSPSSMKELFGFGSNILLISVIATIFRYIYNPILGRSYSTMLLGSYTNADTYSSMPSNIFLNMTNKVSYPIMATMQDDDKKLRDSSRKLIQNIMYVSFFVMFGLAAVARPLLLILFGTKMVNSIIFFQVLCAAYVILPMHIINQNILKIKGYSNLFLRTELIKYIVFIPIIIAGIIYGLPVLVGGIVFYYWISFFVNAMFSKRLIGYSGWSQCLDFLPVMMISLIPALIVFGINYVYQSHIYLIIIIQGILYVGMVVGLSLILKLEAFFEIKGILKNKLTVLNVMKTLKK